MEFHLGAESDKRAAWVDVDGIHATGRMTVWESGECDTEALETSDGTQIRYRSRVLGDPSDVTAEANELVDLIADHT